MISFPIESEPKRRGGTLRKMTVLRAEFRIRRDLKASVKRGWLRYETQRIRESVSG